jgi:ADP-ribose pyrophosphatase
VLLYDPTLDAIGMVEQFRIGAAFRAGSPWLLELVAGLVEEGETPAEVAVRETTEESACVIRELLPVAGYFSSPGGTDEYFHLFCARVDLGDAGGLHGKAGEHEDIRLHVIPYAEVAQLQRDGHFNNAHTLIALQWLAMHRDEVRRAWT